MNWNIPDELKKYNFWLTWHFQERPGCQKPIKKPNVNTGTWEEKSYYSYPDVLKEYDRCQQNNKSKADGIGLAFTSKNNLIGIDIDGINNDVVSAEIKAILTAGKSTYIEKSISGNGYHIIGTVNDKSLLLKLFQNYNGRTGAKSKDLKIELYVTGRYFTISGNCINNNFGDAALAFALAWEYITHQSILNSVAGLYNQRSDTSKNSVASTINSVASIANKRSDTLQTSVAGTNNSVASLFPPCPQNAFTDKEINNLKLLSFTKTIKIMYKGNPTLKDILTKDGIEDNLTKLSSNEKDTSRSGIDMEIISSIVFWLYRYDDKRIIDFLKKSKLNRNDKHNLDDYFLRTVKTAKENAIEYFPATYGLNSDGWNKLRAWQAWKKNCAKALKNV